MNNQYKHAGEPFTAKIAAELILELCKGETLKKEKIRDRVYEHHEKQGGEKYEGSRTLNQCFNDALNKDLKQKRGLADNKNRGYWTILGEPPSNDAPDEPIEGCVYIYYYPAYKELAELKGKDKWPCKIGRTERDAEKRIKEQGTGMPEHATQEVVIKTDDPNSLEQTIRSLLKRKGMHIQEAPGDEWYLINSEIAKKVAEAFEDFQKKLDFI
ncbi:hypothetical protein C6501_12230 [Candidatus Poribacteria bacterium]|nr:MAG: hypothetical protein C6501_12230 [Candidatus Poribacteria bacterium]